MCQKLSSLHSDNMINISNVLILYIEIKLELKLIFESSKTLQFFSWKFFSIQSMFFHASLRPKFRGHVPNWTTAITRKIIILSQPKKSSVCGFLSLNWGWNYVTKYFMVFEKISKIKKAGQNRSRLIPLFFWLRSNYDLKNYFYCTLMHINAHCRPFIPLQFATSLIILKLLFY